MPEWYFEPFPRIGGFKAGAGRRLLEGTEMQQPETFIRETLQNSCDAQRSGELPVKVEYRIVSSGDQKSPDVRSVLRLAGANSPSERGLIQVPKAAQLLYVEDFNTVGLGGTSRADLTPKADDNFVRLCRNIGDTQETAGRGGTFGFGKSVYWSASNISLVVFYSRFKPTERTGGHYSRFIAAGWFDDHELAELRYTGRAWFGDLVSTEEGRVIEPLVDEDADSAAAKLNFRPRASDEHCGTSILVIGARIADRNYMPELRAAVEAHYWPRILDGRLDVSFYYGEDSVGGPDLSSRVDLRAYLAAYRLLGEQEDLKKIPDVSQIEDLSYSTRGRGAQRWHLGRVATVVTDTTESRDDAASLSKGIALIRAPRMVVQYYTASGGLPDIAYGSVFVASEEVEEILKKSEPPAHDRWSSASNALSPVESKVVTNLLAKVRRAVGEFLESFIEKDTSSALTCAALGRQLAKYMALKGGGTAPGPSPRLAAVQFPSQPHRLVGEEGVHRLASTVEVSVTKTHIDRFRRQFEMRPSALAVNVVLNVLMETGQKAGRTIGIDVLKASGGDGERVNGSVVFPLDGPQEYRIQIVSDPLPSPELTIDLTVAAELSAGEGAE